LEIRLKNSHVVCFLFDLSNKDSLKILEDTWCPFIEQLNLKCLKILVGTKYDLIDNLQKNEIDDFKKRNNIEISFEVSSKSGKNVDNLFTFIIKSVKEKLKNIGVETAGWERDNDSISVLNYFDVNNYSNKCIIQ
jgi:GTPase SAR1 family protein